jgi:hypothetical protein
MHWTEIGVGSFDHANRVLWNSLGDNAGFVVGKLKADPAFASKLAAWVRRELSLPTNWKRASEIMGKNFFGLHEARKHLYIKDSILQVLALEKVPFTEEVLEECKDTHILIAVFPMSILEMSNRYDFFYQQIWYQQERFAHIKGGARWYLIRKSAVSGSASKTWSDQEKLLSLDEIVPSMRVILYTMIGYFRATGERLFQGTRIRCSEVDSRGRHVSVSGLESTGIFLYEYRDDEHDTALGISAARKPFSNKT